MVNSSQSKMTCNYIGLILEGCLFNNGAWGASLLKPLLPAKASATSNMQHLNQGWEIIRLKTFCHGKIVQTKKTSVSSFCLTLMRPSMSTHMSSTCLSPPSIWPSTVCRMVLRTQPRSSSSLARFSVYFLKKTPARKENYTYTFVTCHRDEENLENIQSLAKKNVLNLPSSQFKQTRDQSSVFTLGKLCLSTDVLEFIASNSSVIN